MAEIYDGISSSKPTALRQSPAEAEASFRAKVRALRAIRQATPEHPGHDRLEPAAPAPRPAFRPAFRPWAF